MATVSCLGAAASCRGTAGEGGPAQRGTPPPDIGRAPLEVLVGSGALAGLRGAAVGKRKLAVSQVLSLNE